QPLVVRSPALGEVTRDLDEAFEAARGIAYWREDDVRPELLAVLAESPALFLEAAFRGRGLELPVRLSAGDVLGCEESREMRAQDLLLPVSLDLFGTGIPGRDASHGI